MSDCVNLTIDGMTDELLIDLIQAFVSRQFTRCSQDKFHTTIEDGDKICLRGVELYKHALFMAVVNELTLEACVDAIDKVDAAHAASGEAPIVLSENDGQVEIPSKITP